jgi:DNA-3-methyladenine glycosylase I
MPGLATGLVRGDDGLARCWWGASTPDYATYHDDEWGFEVRDDVRLFEKICLEGFQSGLSWLTILRKRENFRKAFAGFDHHRVARFNQRSVERLLRGKIESTIRNAKRAVELEEEFGSLSAFFWEWVPPASERPRRMTQGALMKLSKTPTSTALSKELKNRGWSFVGPTTVYAFMQAMGLVNDHVEGCFVRERIAKAPCA